MTSDDHIPSNDTFCNSCRGSVVVRRAENKEKEAIDPGGKFGSFLGRRTRQVREGDDFLSGPMGLADSIVFTRSTRDCCSPPPLPDQKQRIQKLLTDSRLWLCFTGRDPREKELFLSHPPKMTTKIKSRRPTRLPHWRSVCKIRFSSLHSLYMNSRVSNASIDSLINLSCQSINRRCQSSMLSSPVVILSCKSINVVGRSEIDSNNTHGGFESRISLRGDLCTKPQPKHIKNRVNKW